MIDLTFLEQLRKLNLIARRKVSSIYVGGRRSICQGRGIEAFDHREYYPGDDFRAIDWKLYGRTEKLYIRRFEEERNLILHILVDSSASMDFSTINVRKFDYAGGIAAGFAYIATRRYEKFGTAFYADKIKGILQSRKGKMHFFRMIDLLNNVSLNGMTNLEVCISQYTNMIKSKSFIVVISDFLEPIESLRNGIYRIAKYSRDAILVQILDPGEIDLKFSDDINFEDMETTKFERAYISPNFRIDYKKRLQEHIFNIQKVCDSAGIEFFSFGTDTPIFDAFLNIVESDRWKRG